MTAALHGFSRRENEEADAGQYEDADRAVNHDPAKPRHQRGMNGVLRGRHVRQHLDALLCGHVAGLPALGKALGQRRNEQGGQGIGQQRQPRLYGVIPQADDVQTARVRVARLQNAGPSQQQSHDGQHDVNQEDPFPARQRQNRSTHDRAEAQTRAEHDAPPGECLAALPPVPKLIGQDGDRADQHHGRAQALEESGDDQHSGAFRQAAYQRGNAEGHDTDSEVEHVRLAAIVLAKGQVPGRIVGRRRDVEAVGLSDAARRKKSPLQKGASSRRRSVGGVCYAPGPPVPNTSACMRSAGTPSSFSVRRWACMKGTGPHRK